MAIPLKDFRLGISEFIDAYLDADAIAFGKDKASIAREILNEWAKRKHLAYKVMAKKHAANGLQPEFDWDTPEDDGSSRSGKR